MSEHRTSTTQDQPVTSATLSQVALDANAAAVRDATTVAIAAEAAAAGPAAPRAEIEALAARLDIMNPESILRFGAEAQSRASAAADAMLEGARNRDAGEAGETLSSLLSTLRGFDVTKL